MVSTDPAWYYFPPWMLWQNRGMWSRRNSVCSESSPKAFDMSSGITKLPITSWSVDNIYNRVLCCKSISINYNMHGWFLCWYHATGWVWWKNGLRAVAMWSSSSFTKIYHCKKHNWKTQWMFRCRHDYEILMQTMSLNILNLTARWCMCCLSMTLTFLHDLDFQEKLELRCELQETGQQMSRQSEYCATLGATCCTLLWRVSRCEDSIQTILAGVSGGTYWGLNNMNSIWIRTYTNKQWNLFINTRKSN